MLAHDKVGCLSTKTYFKCIKRSSLHSLNSPNLSKTGWRMSASLRVRANQAGQWWRIWQVLHIPKKAILASTRIRIKWWISGEHSNLINSPSSGHCLVLRHISRLISVLRSLCLIVCLSICLSICLSVCLSVCLC
jgi:hypothetical protein